MKKFTLFAGSILVVGLSLFCLLQHESNAELRAQNQAQQRRLAELSAEIERQSNLRSQPSHAQSPQPDQLTELLRLRNEVYLLRKLTNTANLVRCTDSEISVGPNLNVSYDTAIWQLLSSFKNSEVQSTTWEIQRDGWVQITVSNHSTQKVKATTDAIASNAKLFEGNPLIWLANATSQSAPETGWFWISTTRIFDRHAARSVTFCRRIVVTLRFSSLPKNRIFSLIRKQSRRSSIRFASNEATSPRVHLDTNLETVEARGPVAVTRCTSSPRLSSVACVLH
jgi:hypothetical protein